MKKLTLFLFSFLVLSSFSFSAMVVDTCETGNLINTLGSDWQTYKDANSTISFIPNSTPAQAGTYCRRMDISLIAGATDIYAGAVTGLNSGWTAVDLSSYAGIRFYAKGTGGFSVGIGTNQTKTLGNHYVGALNPTASWALYEIPFSSLIQIWGTPKPWEPSTAFSVGFTSMGTAGTFCQLWIDNIEFYTAAEAAPATDPNIIILNPKVNQLGYLPAEKKYFCVVTNTASAGNTYRIFDLSGNTVYTSTFTGSFVNDTASTGEGVWKCDFSALTVPGQYRASVNGKDSYNFTVDNNVYDQLFKDSLRMFYLIRCGIAINDSVTGLNKNACHTALDIIRTAGGTKDLTRGWHNAGDFGKWSHMEAISAAYMMWLYELKTEHMRGLNNNIKESGNKISDLLNEAKWGLDWLLKLQNPDGSVYHKSDTEPNFCWGTKPDLDPFTRYVSYQKMDQPQNPSSIDAAVFTAAMAQAARVYEKILPAYSAACRQAALLSWGWLKDHRGVGQTDPYYTDPTSWQEEEWAMAEMYRLTGDDSILSMFETDIASHAFSPMNWMNPEMFGYFTLYRDTRIKQSLKDSIEVRFKGWCDDIISKASASGYGVGRSSADYYWESNEDVLHGACGLLMGYEMTANANYKDAALSQLGYILGNNSLNKSFVTKTGTNYSSKSYNWIWYDYAILAPGWVSGGPNSYSAGAGSDTPLITLINKGTPPAKCWLDIAASNGSYASNEGEATENAALVFLSGYFYSVLYPETGGVKKTLNRTK